MLIEEAMPALSNCIVASNKLTGEALDTSKRIGSSAVTTEEVKTCDKWNEYFKQGVLEANKKAISCAQKVAKWAGSACTFGS